MKKRKAVRLIALFAVFILMIIFAGCTNNTQAPVYEGMEVAEIVSKKDENANFRSFETTAAQTTVMKQQSPDITLTDNLEEPVYSAEQGDDILLHIHFSNPKEFEILSFTLKGSKFNSYMFEQGSTTALIILKVNAGENVGSREYTIDGIKYVDGTKIKNAVIAGEQTIEVNIRLKLAITETLTTEDGFIFDLYNNGTAILKEFQKTDGSSAIIPEKIKGCTVIAIESQAFSFGCPRSIYIPASVIRIDKDVVWGGGEMRCMIFVEAESQPSGWAEHWSWTDNIVWNVKPEKLVRVGEARYLLSENTASLARYEGEGDSLFIVPKTINVNGKVYPVTSVREKAFMISCSSGNYPYQFEAPVE